MNTGASQEGNRPIQRAPVLRRVLAFVVDRLILLGLGLAFLALAGERIKGLSLLWPSLGSAVCWLYLVVSYTRLANGQTLGKRLLGIQVRSAQGGWIRPWSAGLRAFAVLPLICGDLKLFSIGLPGEDLASLIAPPSSAVPTVAALIMGVIATGFLALSILAWVRWLIGILPGRDALGGHDVLLGSVVVRSARKTSPAPPAGALSPRPPATTRRRLAIWAIVLWAVQLAVFIPLIAKWSGPDLRAAADAVTSLPGVADAVVARRYTYETSVGGPDSTTISGAQLIITVRMDPDARGSQAVVRLDAIIPRCLEAVRSIDPRKADAIKSVVVVIADPADVCVARLGDQMEFKFRIPLNEPPASEEQHHARRSDPLNVIDWIIAAVCTGMAVYCFITARGDRKAENTSYAVGYLWCLAVALTHAAAGGRPGLTAASLPTKWVVLLIYTVFVVLAAWWFIKGYRLYKRRLARAKQPQQSEKG